MCPHGYHRSGSMATPALGTRDVRLHIVWIALWSHQSAQTVSSNLDHMYPYQLLVAVAKKKRKIELGGKRETIVAIITEFLIKSLSIHVVSGFHVQSIQIAVYLLQQHVSKCNNCCCMS